MGLTSRSRITIGRDTNTPAKRPATESRHLPTTVLAESWRNLDHCHLQGVAFVTTEATARRYDIRTLSDPANMPAAPRTFCVAGEFFARSDGFRPMLHAYGLGYGKPNGVPTDSVQQMGAGVISPR